MIIDFKKFSVSDNNSAMKVDTNSVLLGVWANIENDINVLDIGTGCGIIALILAQRCNYYVDAFEIDPESCKQAKENVKQSPYNNLVTIHHKSLQEYANVIKKRYGLIVCAPPYFNNTLISENRKRNIARHIYDLPHELLAESVSILLKKDGRFCVILTVEESDKFRKIALNYDLFCIKKTNVFLKPNINLKSVLSEYQFRKIPMIITSLFIKNNDDSYSDEYIKLTKDFYLDF